MYQVLYRKWRPKKFADVVGQPQVTVTLKNELKAGRIAHAYLFTGSRGTGKTTCAKILARAVNCLNPQDGDPCGECEICRGIDSGSVMDIVEIDAASNNGVDNIRSLREEAGFTPASAKYRVYIIDEVHMLSVGAFNALLKTLEEPPAHVIFILATTEVHKLPATILSRCQRFDFHRIPPQDMADRLAWVTQQEGGEIDRQAALLIARLADGALRDALSILDQCLGRSKTVTAQVVADTAGLVGREHLFGLTQAIRNQDSGKALEITDGLYRSSKDMARLCDEVASHFRSMMLIKTMKNAKDVLALPDAEYDELEKQALAIPLSEILHGISAMQEALEKMFRGADRRTVFEMAMIRLCTPQLDVSADALLRRIEALEQRAPAAGKPPVQAVPEPAARFITGAAAKPARQDELPEEEIPEPEEKTESGQAAEMEKLQEWPEILQVAKEFSPSVSAAFNGSSAYVGGGYVLIDASNDMAFKLLRRPEQRDNMRRAIRQITGKTYKLGPYRKPEAEAADDPLAKLARDAEAQGIEVINTNNGGN